MRNVDSSNTGGGVNAPPVLPASPQDVKNAQQLQQTNSQLQVLSKYLKSSLDQLNEDQDLTPVQRQQLGKIVQGYVGFMDKPILPPGKPASGSAALQSQLKAANQQLIDFLKVLKTLNSFTLSLMTSSAPSNTPTTSSKTVLNPEKKTADSGSSTSTSEDATSTSAAGGGSAPPTSTKTGMDQWLTGISKIGYNIAIMLVADMKKELTATMNELQLKMRTLEKDQVEVKVKEITDKAEDQATELRQQAIAGYVSAGTQLVFAGASAASTAYAARAPTGVVRPDFSKAIDGAGSAIGSVGQAVDKSIQANWQSTIAGHDAAVALADDAYSTTQKQRDNLMKIMDQAQSDIDKLLDQLGQWNDKSSQISISSRG